MASRSIQLVVFGLGIAAAFAPACSQAGTVTYEFRGHFESTDRTASGSFVPVSPNELMGQEFTIRITWPTSASQYSADWQPVGGWGSYSTTAVNVEIEVPGFDFSVPPTISRWETYNDTTLDYEAGEPLTWGDELRLQTRADWARAGVTNPLFATRYTVWLHAPDYTGSIFTDDSLQADFDLTIFKELWFEFNEAIPVAGSDPRPIRYEHWLGVVDSMVLVPEPASMVVVPEPASICLAFLALLGGATCRRRG